MLYWILDQIWCRSQWRKELVWAERMRKYRRLRRDAILITSIEAQRE